MTYENTTLKDLYNCCTGQVGISALEAAVFWVEAENIQATWELVKHWFDLMQSGAAQDRYPDPFWQAPPGRRPLTPEVADQIVSEMDEDFQKEANRFPDSTHLGPEFRRLPPHARMAFGQELYDVMLTSDEIKAEATRRLAAGEQLPPAQAPVDPGVPF